MNREFESIQDQQSAQISSIEHVADMNWLKFHQHLASSRTIQENIPLIEMDFTPGIHDGIYLNPDEEYILPTFPLFDNFVASPENIEQVKQTLSIDAHTLALSLHENSAIHPEQKDFGTKWVDQTDSGWGRLTVVFNEENNKDKENVVLSVSEIVGTEDGEFSPAIVFLATLHLNGRFKIKEYPGKSTKAVTAAEYTDENNFSLGTDTYRLIDKTSSLIQQYLVKNE